MKKINQLKTLEIFQGIGQETVEKLARAGKISELDKGTILLRAKEPVASVYFQVSGKSIIYNLTHSGKRKILFIYGKGELLNENVFNKRTTSIYAETIDKSKIFIIPCIQFVEIMKEDFMLTKNIMEAQEKKIWRLSHQLKNTMSSIYLERKLAAKLWKLARDFGVQTEQGIEIDVNMSVTFLADMLGVPRETTSRACSVLIDNGLIKMNKKRIIIADSEKMSHFYKTGKFI